MNSIEKQIAELKAQNEDNAKRIAELEKQLTKKGPVVPWVGAFVCNRYSHAKFWWDKTCTNPDHVMLIDSQLHPQFMPNDGENPWPDDMEVQIVLRNKEIINGMSRGFLWRETGNSGNIIGSRPACGWAEYLKEQK